MIRLLIAICCFALYGTAAAQVTHVVDNSVGAPGGTYEYIAEAIAAASDGDTIQIVASGKVYPGAGIDKSGLTFVGSGFDADAPNTHTMVTTMAIDNGNRLVFEQMEIGQIHWRSSQVYFNYRFSNLRIGSMLSSVATSVTDVVIDRTVFITGAEPWGAPPDGNYTIEITPPNSLGDWKISNSVFQPAAGYGTLSIQNPIGGLFITNCVFEGKTYWEGDWDDRVRIQDSIFRQENLQTATDMTEAYDFNAWTGTGSPPEGTNWLNVQLTWADDAQYTLPSGHVLKTAASDGGEMGIYGGLTPFTTLKTNGLVLPQITSIRAASTVLKGQNLEVTVEVQGGNN